jgi:hypothetical protein
MASNMLPYIPSQITLKSNGLTSPFLQRNPHKIRANSNLKNLSKATVTDRERNFNLFKTGQDFRNT